MPERSFSFQFPLKETTRNNSLRVAKHNRRVMPRSASNEGTVTEIYVAWKEGTTWVYATSSYQRRDAEQTFQFEGKNQNWVSLRPNPNLIYSFGRQEAQKNENGQWSPMNTGGWIK